MEVSEWLQIPTALAMEKGTDTNWLGGWMGPRAGLDASVRRRNPSSYQESNSGYPARSLVTILTELPRLDR
jgi:hypothetical protein